MRPAVNGPVICEDVALGQHFLQLSIADTVFTVPAHRPRMISSPEIIYLKPLFPNMLQDVAKK